METVRISGIGAAKLLSGFGIRALMSMGLEFGGDSDPIKDIPLTTHFFKRRAS